MAQGGDVNERFLRDLFDQDWEQVLIVTFTEDPEYGDWTARTVQALKVSQAWPLDPGNANYFCEATFTKDSQGKDRRVKDLFRALHVLGVDDVGTLVDAGRLFNLLGAPSRVVETSPGNEQWFYKLTPPVTDLGRAQMLTALPKSHATGVTRMMRLPVGHNTKPEHGPGGFATVLRIVDDTVGRLDIDKIWDVVSRETPEDAGRVWGLAAIAPAHSVAELIKGDEIGQLLQSWGMLNGKLTGDGVGVQCECPQKHLHKGERNDGAAYYPRSKGFVCHHKTFCGNFKGAAFRKWVDEEQRQRTGQGLKTLLNEPATGQFDKVDDPGPGTPRVEFLRDLRYVRTQDKFWSWRDRSLLTRDAVNSTWRKPLRSWLLDLRPAAPARGKRPKAMAPVQAFFEADAHVEVAKLVQWPGRGEMITDPDEPIALNTWRPEPRPLAGQRIEDVDVMPFLEIAGDLSDNEGRSGRELMLDWGAFGVGDTRKPGFHLLLVSPQEGLGKGLFCRGLAYAVGQQRNYSRPTVRQLRDKFLYFLTKRLVQIDDPEKHSGLYDLLKPLLENTADFVEIELKRAHPYMGRDWAAWIFTSNRYDDLKLPSGARRIAVVSTDKAPRARAYYDDFVRWFAAGGNEKVKEWLWQRYERLSPARIREMLGRAPDTFGKQIVVDVSEDPIEGFITTMLGDGVLLEPFAISELEKLWVQQHAHRLHLPSEHDFGRALGQLGVRRLYNGNGVRLRKTDKVKTKLWSKSPENYFGMSEGDIRGRYWQVRELFGDPEIDGFEPSEA